MCTHIHIYIYTGRWHWSRLSVSCSSVVVHREEREIYIILARRQGEELAMCKSTSRCLGNYSYYGIFPDPFHYWPTVGYNTKEISMCISMRYSRLAMYIRVFSCNYNNNLHNTLVLLSLYRLNLYSFERGRSTRAPGLYTTAQSVQNANDQLTSCKSL